MKIKPKVTVYLSSFNHAGYLRESIDSILNQTFTDFELRIYDDASTDESWEIINSYSDSRIHRHHRTLNPIKDWVETAQGKYIAIHHSDDVWLPTKLEMQVSFLDKHPEIGAVFSNAQPIDDESQDLEDKNHFYSKVFDQPNRTRHEWLNFFFYNVNALCHPSVLIRKVCYEECGFYKSTLAQFPDLDMWVRLCMKYEIHVFPEKLVRFRVRKGELNASGDRPETRTRSQFEILQILNYFRQIRDKDEFLKIFPSTKDYFLEEGYDLDYALAMTAVRGDTTPATNLFGLQLLYDCLCDPVKADKLLNLYNFSNREFIALTGSVEVFYYWLYLDMTRSKAWIIANGAKRLIRWLSGLLKFK